MEENVIFQEKCGIKYLQFKKLLDLGVNHCYTLKQDDINFDTACKYEDSSWEKVCKALNIDRKNVLFPKQAHTDVVKCVNENSKLEDLRFSDGLMTDRKNVALATKNADCILFLFYDPVKKVIANVHSGWRGTYGKISEKTILKMMNNYGCKPEDIYCFISPSIRKDHFEVDIDVMELGKELFEYTGRTEEFIEKGRIVDDKQKYNIDTVLINKIMLEDVGVKPEKIIDCNICSMCHKDIISSARAEGKNFTRAIALITL